MVIGIKNGYVITAERGTGDNLLDEDLEEGFVDYLNTNLYAVDGIEMELKDGGFMMLKEPWEKVLKRAEEEDFFLPYKEVLKFWDFDPEDNDWTILDY